MEDPQPVVLDCYPEKNSGTVPFTENAESVRIDTHDNM